MEHEKRTPLKSTSRTKLKDGDPFVVRKKKGGQGWLIHRCCDCGLEHDLCITSDRYTFTLRFWRRKKG